MKRFGFALTMAAVVAAATWAYGVNYRTKQVLARLDRLHAEIASEREAVEVLRVEWAYLNRPERLRRLVALVNDRLGLAPISPAGFAEIAELPFPPLEDEGAIRDDTPPPPGDRPAMLLGELTGGAPVPVPPPRPASWRP